MLPLAPEHADQAAALHIAGQPGTFLTRLGPEVLGAIYAALPAAPTGFGFVAVAQETQAQPGQAGGDATILGFISATTGAGSLFAEMVLGMGIRRMPRLILALLRRMVRRPGLIWQSFQTILYPYKTDGSEEIPAAELLSIMVDKPVRGQGIGARLLDALVDECVLRGLSQLDVTVDGANDGAQRFYYRHGFVHHRQFTLYGRAMVQLRRRLSPVEETAAGDTEA